MIVNLFIAQLRIWVLIIKGRNFYNWCENAHALLDAVAGKHYLLNSLY